MTDTARQAFFQNGSSPTPDISMAGVARAEAYATLVYGDTPAACAAVVLGITLRRHDPTRERIAIVRDLSNRTREVLTHGGLWRLHEARAGGAVGRRRRFVETLSRKNELWRLPYSRVLYLDADTFLLRDPATRPGMRSARLRRLWSRHAALDESEGARLGATGVMPAQHRNYTLASTCFNGGFLLLRPSASVADSLDRIDPHAALRRPEPLSGRRCPGLDQPLLNRAFPPSSWRRIADSDWLSVTHWLASPAYPRTCSLETGDALSEAADAYHFFHQNSPTENEHCAACVRGGMRCRSIVPMKLECTVQGVANQLFWQELLGTEIAPAIRRTCLELTEQTITMTEGDVDASEGAGRRRRAAAKLRLRAGMCTGCAKRPRPACF